MQAGIFNLVDNCAIEQGSDFAFSFIYKDVNGNPVNLTSATITGRITSAWNASTLANFTITKHNPATDGYVGVSLAASSSATIAPGRYKYDIRISLNGVSHVIKGNCDILESVTFS
jgi:hypothetical protein